MVCCVKKRPAELAMESCEKDYGISYSKAAEYWNDIPPTIDGMLGGFAKISGTDIDGSSKFLKGLFRLDDAPGNARCLDCGAGIGFLGDAPADIPPVKLSSLNEDERKARFKASLHLDAA